jgi:hypothetical protein
MHGRHEQMPRHDGASFWGFTYQGKMLQTPKTLGTMILSGGVIRP